MSSILKGIIDESEDVMVLYINGNPATKYTSVSDANKDLNRLKEKFPEKKFELKNEIREGVLQNRDEDPEVAVLGGAGTYSLSALKRKAVSEAMLLADDIAKGKFSNSAFNIKQLANTLNTIVAAEKELDSSTNQEDGYTGTSPTGTHFYKGKSSRSMYSDFDESTEFAAEKTPAVNPYGGQPDNKFRGGISEGIAQDPKQEGYQAWKKYLSSHPKGPLPKCPHTDPKVAKQWEEGAEKAFYDLGELASLSEAGQRRYKPKPAGTKF